MINITREQFFAFIKNKHDSEGKISPETQYYLDYFDRYQRTGDKIGRNWSSLWGPGWFCYRKMYLSGCLLGLVDILSIHWLISVAMMFFLVRYADYMYLKHANNKIAQGITHSGTSFVIAFLATVLPGAIFLIYCAPMLTQISF
jgi:hypothetical protein